MTITLRNSKGSELTFAEMDTNFSELDFRTQCGWNDLVSDVSVTVGSAAPNQEIFRGNIICYSFPPDTLAEAFANFHMRHDYVSGTMVYPHVHWTCNSNDVGTVRWGCEYTLARRGDSTGLITFGPTSTLYIEHTVGVGEQYKHHVNEIPDGTGIPGTNLEVDALILCRFFRDATHQNDTFTGNALLLTVDLHYECQTMATPLRFPPFS